MKLQIILFMIMLSLLLHGCQTQKTSPPNDLSELVSSQTESSEESSQQNSSTKSSEESLQQNSSTEPSEESSSENSSQYSDQTDEDLPSVDGITEYIRDKTIVYISIDINCDGIEERLYYDPYRHGVVTEMDGVEVSFLDFASDALVKPMDFNASGFGKIGKGYKMVEDSDGNVYMWVNDGILITDVPEFRASYFHSILSWIDGKWVLVDDISYTKIDTYPDEESDGTTTFHNIERNGVFVESIDDVLNIYSDIEDKIYYIPYR